MNIPHIPLNFRLRNQSGHAVNDDGINGAAAHQLFGNVQGLLGGIGLGNQQAVNVQPAVGGILGIQGVFGVNVRRQPAQTLRLRHNMNGQRGFAGRLAAVNLRDPAPRQSPHPQRQVQRQRPGGDGVGNQMRHLLVAAHHRPLAVIFLDAPQGKLQGRQLVLVQFEDGRVNGHWSTSARMFCHCGNGSTPVPPMQGQFASNSGFFRNCGTMAMATWHRRAIARGCRLCRR